MHPPLSEREHTRLGAHRLTLGPGRVRHLLPDGPEVDAPKEVHLAGVDAHDVDAAVEVGVGELDLAVDAAGAEEGGVEGVDTVRGHDDLDVLGGLEAVELK